MAKKRSRRNRGKDRAPIRNLKSAPVEVDRSPPAKEPLPVEGLLALLARNRLVSLIVFLVVGTFLAAVVWSLLAPPA